MQNKRPNGILNSDPIRHVTGTDQLHTLLWYLPIHRGRVVVAQPGHLCRSAGRDKLVCAVNISVDAFGFCDSNDLIHGAA